MSAPMEVVLAQQPKDTPDADTFRVQPQSNPPTEAPPGGLLLRIVVASVDPYQRELIRGLQPGAQMKAYQVARVVESKHAGYQAGDHVLNTMANLTWQTVQQHSGDELYKIPSHLSLPVTAWCGVLGMPGRTAYFGLTDHEVGRMQPGKVVLVSGAAGTVGSLAGQLARVKGAARVIGTAGGADKCRHVKERYGFDECLDYKALDSVEKMTEALKRAAPDGIDLFYDNTGGHVMRAAFNVFRPYGRMVLCGSISSYNKNKEEDLIPNVLSAKSFPMIYKSINIRAFSQRDYVARFHEFYDEMPQLVADGKIVYDTTIYKGLDKIPEAFAGLFHGHNTGKAMVLVD